jgi:hypothetical protein
MILLALLLTVTAIGPVSAHAPQDEVAGSSPTISSTTIVSKSKMEEMMRTVPIRNRFTAKPPPPQPYWKIYIADHFALVCWHDDDTGKLEYCDLYIF